MSPHPERKINWNLPIPWEVWQDRSLPFLPQGAHLFMRTVINNESSLFGSCWLQYAGSLLGAGDGVTARRNNASPVGPCTRRKPRSIVGSSPWSRKGLSACSNALVSHPAGKQGHQATSHGCQGWGLPALVSFSVVPDLTSRALLFSSDMSCSPWTCIRRRECGTAVPMHGNGPQRQQCQLLWRPGVITLLIQTSGQLKNPTTVLSCF